MITSTYRVIDLRNAPGRGEALAGIDLTADAGLVVARTGTGGACRAAMAFPVARPRRWDTAAPARASQRGR